MVYFSMRKYGFEPVYYGGLAAETVDTRETSQKKNVE
jgi:hypothetical protein